LRHLIYGRPVIIVTDHHALCWIHNIKDHSRRLARWALKLAEFDYSVVYKKGSKHQDADCLSRNPALHIDNMEIEELDDVPTFTISTVKIDELQDRDKDLRELKKAILDPDNSTCNAITRQKAKNFRIKDNVLYKATIDKDGLEYALVISRTLREEVLWEAHNAPTSGHMGMTKTLSKLSPTTGTTW